MMRGFDGDDRDEQCCSHVIFGPDQRMSGHWTDPRIWRLGNMKKPDETSFLQWQVRSPREKGHFGIEQIVSRDEKVHTDDWHLQNRSPNLRREFTECRVAQRTFGETIWKG